MLEPRALLAQLDLSEAEIDVYLALINGASAARDIIKVTSRSRPTVYYALTALERRGLLSKTGLSDKQRIRLEPLARLSTMVAERQANVTQLAAQVSEFAAEHQHHIAGDTKPHVSFYEGITAVQNVIMESIYCHSRHIDSLVPTTNFFWQLGSSFVERYVATRQSLGVTTRNLWGATIDGATIHRYYTRAELRILPAGLGEQFKTTIFMYDHSVLYVSSLASGYALLMRSEEHYELMQMMYNGLWQTGTPLVPV